MQGNNLDYSIDSWGEADDVGTIDVTFGQSCEYIEILKTDFDGYPIKMLSIGNKDVAILCRELLYNDDIKSLALVCYPYRNGKIDLTTGKVVKKIGDKGDKHGGSVSWNTDTNTFTYTEGSESMPSKIWMRSNGEVTTTQTSDCVTMSVCDERLIDARGDEVNYYSLVKIGTQCWTFSNLKAKCYRNGKNITKKSTYTTSAAGYFQSSHGDVFYNKAAVTSDMLAPKGYRIANYSDWSMLKAYLHKDASLIKSSPSWGGSNYDQFCAEPIGAYLDPTGSKAEFDLFGTGTVFWVMGQNSTTVWESALMLTADSNEMQNATPTDLSAFSVRCVKE
jgi:uncharacterized protein (TIGR02145 family)